jgi:hypothetical protein
MINYKKVERLSCGEEHGDLLEYEHVLSGEYYTVEDCGSHGCCGHRYYLLICSCGFATQLYSGGSEIEQSAVEGHKQDVIMAHLGLSFQFEGELGV